MILFIILVIYTIPDMCKFDESGDYFAANVAIAGLVNVVMPLIALTGFCETCGYCINSNLPCVILCYDKSLG